MSNNQQVFLELVSAGLWEKEVQLLPYGDINWQEVYRLSTEQSVLGLVLAGLEHSDVKPPQVLLLQWIGEVQVIEQRNKEMNAFVADLIEKFRKADIYALLVKGQGVAQCYERPFWRACGDIDFFLSGDNYNKAKKYLLPFAVSSEPEERTSMTLSMTVSSWIIELHGILHASLSYRINKELERIKQDTFYGGNVRSWINGSTHVFLLSPENDVIYVFVHLLNHFYKGGVGLRQICDWCRLLWNYKDSLKKDFLYERIKEMGIISEWKAFGAFAVDYLGMPSEAMPFYSPSVKWDRKAKRIGDFIIEVGNFGHNRDFSYFNKKPYLIRKLISFGWRLSDLVSHARIFPVDSLRFFPNILFNGVRSVVRGE